MARRDPGPSWVGSVVDPSLAPTLYTDTTAVSDSAAPSGTAAGTSFASSRGSARRWELRLPETGDERQYDVWVAVRSDPGVWAEVELRSGGRSVGHATIAPTTDYGAIRLGRVSGPGPFDLEGWAGRAAGTGHFYWDRVWSTPAGSGFVPPVPPVPVPAGEAGGAPAAMAVPRRGARMALIVGAAALALIGGGVGVTLAITGGPGPTRATPPPPVTSPPPIGGSISLDLKSRLVDFTDPTKLSGTLSTGENGMTVVLEANQFPFTAGFHEVASTTTAHSGKFSFERKQPAATKYFVALENEPSVRSNTRTAYVDYTFSDFTCVIESGGRAYPCNNNISAQGSATVHISFQLHYPSAAYPTEASKPHFVYYGQRNGPEKHPATLQLKRRTHQKRVKLGVTEVVYDVVISIPAGPWNFGVTSCAKDTESVDGLGLPGHHHCGEPSIAYRLTQPHSHLG